MKGLPMQEGEHIILRPFQQDDAEIYSSWLRDSELRGLVGEKERSIDDVLEKQQEWTDSGDYIEYIIVDKNSGTPIGDIDIKGLNDSKPKYGIMIADPNLRGHGYGKEAMALLFAYARQIGLKEIYAEVYVDNTDSKRFHERVGFENLGVILDEDKKECFLFMKELK